MPIRQLAANYARGLLMGGADVIPGVSGGTVALILGIYERLIRAIRMGASALVTGLRVDFAGARRRFGEVEWLLVLPLGAGILTALVIGARVIPPLLEDYREAIYALFFGLILGSVIVPFRRIERVGRAEVALIALAAVVAFIVVGLPPREIPDPALPYVFAAAAVAICAMILPGVSGAFLLLVFGIYATSLDALRTLNLPYVLTFVAGAAIGLASFARILEWLLVHRHALTMAALTGLMIGGVRALWPWQTEERVLLAPPDLGALAVLASVALAGFVAVSLLVWVGGASSGRLSLTRPRPAQRADHVPSMPPPIAGLSWRALKMDDAEALHGLFRVCEAFDKQPFVTTIKEVRQSMSDKRLDLSADTLSGWTDDGRLVCFGAARARAAAVQRWIVYQDGQVHPDWRRRGLGDAVLAWTEARSRALLARPRDEGAAANEVPAFLEVSSNERHADRRALYEQRGYRPVRYYTDMRRPLSEPLTDARLPEGLRLVGWTPETDEQFRVTHNTAFQDHWGSEPLTPYEWQTRISGSPPFRANLTVGAVDGERLVSYVMGYHAPADTEATGRVEGWLGQIGTLREWRGRGVATALMVHVMRLMRDAGFDDAMLDVDTENPSGALGMYERLGFRSEHRFIRWEKPAI